MSKVSRRRNAADEGQVQEATRDAKLRRERELNDLRSVLNTVEGRRFLWRILEFCGLYKTSFTGSSETFFLEGQRNVGIKLITEIIETEPEAYLLMMKEHRKGEELNV